VPKFSAFTAFSGLRFSSRPSEAELFYRDIVRGLGGNYTEEFDSLAMARVYANAMAFARAKMAIKRAGQQFRPSRILEMLPAAEREYGIIPEPGSPVSARRRELAAAMRIARGATQTNVDAVLSDLLIDDFVSYLPVPLADAVVSTASPGTTGIYPVPGTQRSAFRLTAPVATTGSPITVSYEAVTGASTELVVGDKIAIDTADAGRIEVVDVTAVGAGTFTATFTKPHNSGLLFSTGRLPHFWNTRRHNVLTLSVSGAATARVRRRANKAMRRLLRGVSTWALTDGSAPFTVGAGLLGATLIGPDPFSPTDITGLVAHFDLQDTDSYTVATGSPDTVTSLTNKASSVAWTEATNPPEYEASGLNGYPCIKGNASDMHITSTEAAVWGAVDGEDAPFSIYGVIQPSSGTSTLEAWFGIANSGDATPVLRFEADADETEFRRIDDVAGSGQILMSGPTTAPQVLSFLCTGAQLRGYRNTSVATTQASDIGAITLDRASLLRVPFPTPARYSGARVGEVLLYSGSHTETQRLYVSRYLMSKWGIAPTG
jgi:hypothetical protein